MVNKIENYFDSKNSQAIFVIPTYRPQEIGETVARYSENFRSFGYSVPIIVFDDSRGEENRKRALKSFTEAEIDYPGNIWYVGEIEKKRFLSKLETKTKIPPRLLQKIFRPSYGGNRNFTLAYTLGNLFISSDDDMYPLALFERQKGLKEGEILKGRYVPREGRYRTSPDDILVGFLEVLGKSVAEVPDTYERGNLIQDSNTDLLTNNTKPGALNSPNTLSLIRGEVSPTAIIKLAQTFRTGSSDVDSKDYVEEFLRNPVLVTMSDLSKVYAISDYKPCITKVNWRMDCGVAGYDNRQGLPPFIPTSLRFEDYMFRIWSQKQDIASAHVDSTQTHKRNPSNRPSLAEDYLNEELSAILKDEMRRLNDGIEDLVLHFDEGINIDSNRIGEIFERGQKLYTRAQSKSKDAFDRKGHYVQFANALFNSYYRFDREAFSQSVTNTLKTEMELLRRTLEVWPTIVEESMKLPKSAKLLDLPKIQFD
ncbi:MAG: hypothetical protein WC584_02750 [Candidatus Pacearchaeota archaeon]